MGPDSVLLTGRVALVTGSTVAIADDAGYCSVELPAIPHAADSSELAETRMSLVVSVEVRDGVIA